MTVENISRRSLLRLAATAAVVSGASPLVSAMAIAPPAFKQGRPAVADRKFRSDIVEAFINETVRLIPDPELAILFSNCFPNTLDTTVEVGEFEGKPDTAVLTGDIAAMWLRDSSAQVWPYLVLAKRDPQLRRLLEGVIRRQARCILIDPYANSFMADLSQPPLEWSTTDKTEMHQGVGERKFEIDSLCYPIRLAHGYWKQAGDTAPFDARWAQAMKLVVSTLRTQQRKHGPGPYSFQRKAENPSDSLINGIGNPVNPVGLIASGFRPSDDSCIFSFLVPSNLFAVTSMRQLAAMSKEILHDNVLAAEALALADEVEKALQKYAVIPTDAGTVWAYEVDGFGGRVLMDDANVPSLLALPYLESSPDAALYQRTRKFVWSASNPWFIRGSAGEGIGGPHIGPNMIWPMSQTIYALTSTNDDEIRRAIQMLKKSSAGTGFMHESYFKDDPAKFTRAWFAWANTLFGELVSTIAHSKPGLLRG
jgi:meiotically up-regulated gene 157 (Mug157) protein